ncbi:putative transporter C36.02c [Pseudocercospora fuligena]|uniref:Putative transporter C36.02c n=1 Tax=Pseudocercospora fuligena TaxID=685502 RepID=A0A8H6RMZ1_9PEZI|nr:putative transporter C36.02c [Pseudocercospora fuligena]
MESRLSLNSSMARSDKVMDEEKQDHSTSGQDNYNDPQESTDIEKNEPAQPTQGSSNNLSKILSRVSRTSRHGHRRDPEFQVKFDENDKDNPRSFSTPYKALITLQLGFFALTASIASSIIAPAEPVISQYIGVSEEVTVLVVALYILGFAFGPMMWAPISEVYGRKWSILPAVFILGLFSIGTATSTNAASVFITRFFGGLFGSAPVSNVSAALGDMYEPRARGIAVTFYAVMVVGGPCLGPVVGAALTANPHLGWRWTEYIAAIFAFFMVALTFFTLPELYSPVLLKRKARRMRNDTGDDRFWHPHESEKMKPSNILTKYFSRPIRMLVTEPMVTCIAAYASFVYGILYMTLEVFPIVFRDERGYSTVVSTLPFLALFVGVLCAVGINLANQSFYAKAVAENNGNAAPEARLPPMFIGGFLFTIGLFWLVYRRVQSKSPPGDSSYGRCLRHGTLVLALAFGAHTLPYF